MKNICIVLLLAAFSLCYGCVDKECSIKYKFLIPATTSNYKDTIRVGDTLWVTVTIPNTLVNQNDGTSIDVSKMPYSALTVLIGIDQSPEYAPGSKIDIVQGKGKVTNFGSSFRFICTQEATQKIASFGLVPKQRGVYTFQSQQEVRSDEPLKDVKVTESNCSQYLETEFSMNNRSENHFSLLKDSPDSIIKAMTRQEFDKFGMYAFVVK